LAGGVLGLPALRWAAPSFTCQTALSVWVVSGLSTVARLQNSVDRRWGVTSSSM
jgi:hypothetical protein